MLRGWSKFALHGREISSFVIISSLKFRHFPLHKYIRYDSCVNNFSSSNTEAFLLAIFNTPNFEALANVCGGGAIIQHEFKVLVGFAMTC